MGRKKTCRLRVALLMLCFIFVKADSEARFFVSRQREPEDQSDYDALEQGLLERDSKLHHQMRLRRNQEARPEPGRRILRRPRRMRMVGTRFDRDNSRAGDARYYTSSSSSSSTSSSTRGNGRRRRRGSGSGKGKGGKGKGMRRRRKSKSKSKSKGSSRSFVSGTEFPTFFFTRFPTFAPGPTTPIPTTLNPAGTSSPTSTGPITPTISNAPSLSGAPSSCPSISNMPSLSAAPSTFPTTSNAPSLSKSPSSEPSSQPSMQPSLSFMPSLSNNPTA